MPTACPLPALSFTSLREVLPNRGSPTQAPAPTRLAPQCFPPLPAKNRKREALPRCSLSVLSRRLFPLSPRLVVSMSICPPLLTSCATSQLSSLPWWCSANSLAFTRQLPSEPRLCITCITCIRTNRRNNLSGIGLSHAWPHAKNWMHMHKAPLLRQTSTQASTAQHLLTTPTATELPSPPRACSVNFRVRAREIKNCQSAGSP
jgi:hypothetical protein